MATARSVWGIDIGQSSLKALKLTEADGQLQVEALDLVEYPQLLSEEGANAGQLIRQALDGFLARNNLAGAMVAVSVPGQSGFTRFVKLPPVEPKKIPDIVRFEAEQQIPFPINDVIWRWQSFTDSNSPDIQAGIFAMKKGDIYEMLGHFDDVQVGVDLVQMAPLSLLNFIVFDEQVASDGATLLADVGAAKTDLVVSDGPRIWTRTIQIGGNHFTEALAKAFKLSFAKAEKLKRSAATSKYARQIFQAMRPVFADLAQEIQRSVGYYMSMRREARFRKVLGLGNGFRMPGLQKFLEQQLNVPVVRIDSYKHLKATGSTSPAALDENVLSFAVAYGLAAQGLGLAQVNTNLLPDEIVRKRVWGAKRPWFIAAAALLLVALAGPLYRAYVDRKALAESPTFRQAQEVVANLGRQQSQYTQLKGRRPQEEQQINRYKQLFGYRDFWPSIMQMISRTIEHTAQDQRLVDFYASATSDQQRQQALEQIKAKPRAQREMVFVESVESAYYDDVSTVDLEAQVKGDRSVAAARSRSGAPVDPTAIKRGYVIKITGRTPLPREAMVNMLVRMKEQTQKEGKAFPIIQVKATALTPLTSRQGAAAGRGSQMGPMGMDYNALLRGMEAEEEEGYAPKGPGEPKGPANPDPLVRDEDKSDDTYFVFAWLVTVEGDGVTPASAQPAAAAVDD